ncbi:MAG: NnrU family protein [Alphaproteobacteria bacterium]
MHELILATLAFVLGHFMLSSQALRRPLIARLGEIGFRAAYSVTIAATFVWMLLSYAAAPAIAVIDWPLWTRWLPVATMPFALLLAVCAYTTRNVTAVGGESQGATRDPAPGIMRITRHPFLVGAALWAAAHLLANGDAASLVLFGGILVLSVGGMAHIDARRRASMGSAWGPVALTTSAVPFLALLTGRTRPDWSGIGLWRVATALGLYVLLLVLHLPLFGVSPFPA